ncbi:conserved repeat domain-containing protein [Agreia bicolorata]|uniref:Conserved repeat domain-containing protein n=1 Tax=Agreia bicolorata TaxID=110935 RepID=A0A1T4WXG6_9MICO|nr:DUF5979 domain-containing protein [Agreia bicolorata]SKA81575.1 conserved repeat domain-containing protein [Agreia bicolorata]
MALFRIRPGARITAVAATLVAVLLGSVVVATPAVAAPDGLLTISKIVNGEEAVNLAPGDEFDYTITVGCDDNDCLDARLVDAIPAQFDGFEVRNTSVQPSSQASTVSWNGCSTVVTTACELSVAFEQDLGDGAVGIKAGLTYQVVIGLTVPDNLQPSWPSNGVAVTNTAQASSTSAPTVTDGADVTVIIPSVIDVAVSKTWQPGSQLFTPGSASTIVLSAQNTSNVAADSIELLEPSSASVASGDLAADNPFSLVDFTGFGAVSLPEGAESVRVDAYVFDSTSGSYEWVPGSPRAPGDIALPTTVVPADVAGLRIAFVSATGGTIVPSGNAGSVAIEVAQRATDRRTESPLFGGASITNQASATIAVAGSDPVSKQATAPFVIEPLSVAVSAGKTITPSRIPAGTSAEAAISAKNDSSGPVTRLTLTDDDFFTSDLTFDGFSSPISYPAGATEATVTWLFSGGAGDPLAVADGSTPPAPTVPSGQTLVGFELSFTGSIESGAVADATFGIAASGTMVAEDTSPVRVTNTVDVEAANARGTANDSASAPLDIFYPHIDIDLEKTISPTGSVAAGATVVVQLPTSTGVDSAYVNPNKMVVTDVWRSGVADDFWNAFDPIAVAPTQVLAGSTLTIDYSTDGGATWIPFQVVDATAGTTVYSGNLPAGATSTITGLRYTFENPDGFSQGTEVTPNTVFQARGQLRDGSGPTSVSNADASIYTNVGTAVAEGQVAGVPVVRSETVDADAPAAIRSNSGPGSLMASKAWRTPDFSEDLSLLSSQSGDRAGTVLGWGVNSTGFSSVTITDPSSDPSDVAQTAFQAFDLLQIAPVTFAQDPLLKWDTVSQVELFIDGEWQSVTAPSGGWMSAAGFVGYTLTSAQVADTTGVRLTVVPNDAARVGSSDPFAPPAGSGVSSSANDAARPIGLVWQLRNTVRDTTSNSNRWVTATHGYNDADPATIVNTVDVRGVSNGTPVGPRSAEDNISLIDQPPAVDLTKTSSRSSIVVPNPGDVPASDYPRNNYTITATNQSSSRASYIRVSDPMTCATVAVENCLSAADGWSADPYASASYDPTTNPFERFTLTGLTFSDSGAGVDPVASTVTLWKRSDTGALSSTTATLLSALAMSPAALADVVGISVLYQGVDPATDGGSITVGDPIALTLKTQVRVSLRSDPSVFVTPVTIDNYAFTQGYDPVLFPAGMQSRPNDSANATLVLQDGALGVTAAKTFSPRTLLEKDRTNPVTATLRATQGSATVATNEVTIEDTDQDFWNVFRLTGLAASDVTLPAGADRVRIDVQQNGTTDWVSGTASSGAALPAVDPATVTGIRFVFTRADGALFSRTAPPADFTATAVLHLELLDAARADGSAVVFPSTIVNDVTTRSHRRDNPAIYVDATALATDSIQLGAGSFTLDVMKSPQNGVHSVTPGDPNQWTLVFTNTGTGFLTVPSVVDVLDDHLSWDGETPVFATSSGGILSTDVQTAFDPASRAITFSWPAGGQRMAPGEKFTITVGITLEAGLVGGQRATNQFVVSTAQTLSACTNTSGNGQGTLAGVASNECGTSNYVQPVLGASLLTTKAVKGDVVDRTVSGARNITTPGGPCIADADGYYRSPCAANTIVGGTDEWKLRAVNSGTVAYTKLTFVEPLPVAGDRLLATGGSRGSTYRPLFDGAFPLAIDAPAGTTITWQVTDAADVCVGSGATAWPSDPTCASHPAASAWFDGAAFDGDWSTVTGIRVVLDFTSTAGQALAPGGSAQVLYRTVNAPATADEPDRAPVTVPVGDPIAWNQFGAQAVLSVGGTLSRAPIKAGVVLDSGSLQVTKTITGEGAAFAPDSFQATVSCTVDGAPVQFVGGGVVTLDGQNGYSTRVDGIPLGAHCAVSENGDEGAYGETTRAVAPSSVSIDVPTDAAAEVPEAQRFAITNDYAIGQLVVSKAVTTQATVGSFGPFEYAAVCASYDGAPLPLAEGDATFSLAAGESHSITGLPVRAECTITETDTDGAASAPNSVTSSTNGAPAVAGASAGVTIGTESNTLAYTNDYAAGTLSVTKTLAGEGQAAYGDGPFTIAVLCTYDGQELYDGSVVLTGGETKTLDDIFPAGTECAVSESSAGGANETTIDQPTVVIPGSEGDATLGAVTVDVTNTFNVGSVDVTKVRDGAGAETYGSGPFTVQVTCTWQKDGETLTIPLPDGGIVQLSEQNDYRATATGLIEGALCDTAETVDGGASSSTVTPAGPVTVPNGEAVEVTVTNTFDTGELVIVKDRVGDGVEAFGAGPFTMQLSCTWLKDGVITPIDLGGDAEIKLSEANEYTATVSGLIAGADCEVVETDRGLATASETDPEDGHIRILADGDEAGPSTVTVTNTFDVGQLSISKTVDTAAAVVGDTVRYTVAVSNIGQIDATDVAVTDTLPDGLSLVTSDPSADAGTPGILRWSIPSLRVGETATFHVTAVADRAGTVVNRASVETPRGPWAATDVEGACTQQTDESCASTVVVMPALAGDGLASTGLGDVSRVLLFALATLLMGLVLAVAVRRRRRA